jgi:hypothetical protein
MNEYCFSYIDAGIFEIPHEGVKFFRIYPFKACTSLRGTKQ